MSVNTSFNYSEHRKQLINKEYELSKAIEHYSKKRITLHEFYEIAANLENEIKELHYIYNEYHRVK